MNVPKFIIDYVNRKYPGTTFIDKNAPLCDWPDRSFVHTPPHKSKTYLEHAKKQNKRIILLMKTSILGTNYFPEVGPCELIFFNHRLLFPGYFRRAPFSSVLVILSDSKIPAWSVLYDEKVSLVNHQPILQHCPSPPSTIPDEDQPNTGDETS